MTKLQWFFLGWITVCGLISLSLWFKPEPKPTPNPLIQKSFDLCVAAKGIPNVSETGVECVFKP